MGFGVWDVGFVCSLQVGFRVRGLGFGFGVWPLVGHGTNYDVLDDSMIDGEYYDDCRFLQVGYVEAWTMKIMGFTVILLIMMSYDYFPFSVISMRLLRLPAAPATVKRPLLAIVSPLSS